MPDDGTSASARWLRLCLSQQGMSITGAAAATPAISKQDADSLTVQASLAAASAEASASASAILSSLVVPVAALFVNLSLTGAEVAQITAQGFGDVTFAEQTVGSLAQTVVSRVRRSSAKVASATAAAISASARAANASGGEAEMAAAELSNVLADWGVAGREAVDCLLTEAACSLCPWRSRGAVDVRFSVAAPPPPPPPKPSPPPPAARRRSGTAGGAPASVRLGAEPPPAGAPSAAELRSQRASAVPGGGYYLGGPYLEYSGDGRMPGRAVLLHNFILGGILLHQTRTPLPEQPAAPQKRSSSGGGRGAGAWGSNILREPEPSQCRGRFAPLSAGVCRPRKSSGALDSAPFGRDPVFAPTSALFQPNVNASLYYNTSEGSGDLSDAGVPFGFLSRETRGYPTGALAHARRSSVSLPPCSPICGSF